MWLVFFSKHTADALNTMFQVTYQQIPCIQSGIFLGVPGRELSLSLNETENSVMVKFF